MTTVILEPSIGRIVHYRLKADDLERFARDNPTARLVKHEDGVIAHCEWSGNALRVGDTFPLVVVRPWHQPGRYERGASVLNGQVLLDGPGVLWALSVPEAGGIHGDGPGTWTWPARS